jgi:hypothetical protein
MTNVKNEQMEEAHALDQPQQAVPEADPLEIPEYLKRKLGEEITETPATEKPFRV